MPSPSPSTLSVRTIYAACVMSAYAGAATAAPCSVVIEPLGTGTSGPVYTMTLANGVAGVDELYIGGDFQMLDGQLANHIGVWNGDAWRVYQHSQVGLPGPVSALAAGPLQFVNPNVDWIFAVGDLQSSDPFGILIFERLQLDGPSTGPVDLLQITGSSLAGPPGGYISKLAYSPDESGEATLLMSGFFFQPSSNTPLAMLDRFMFAEFEWEQVVDPWACCQLANDFLSVDDQNLGTGIFVTGQFYAISGFGFDFQSFAFWDGSTVHDIGGLAGGSVVKGYGDPSIYGEGHALEYVDLGEGPSLYIGGNFEFAGGHDALNIARYDGTDWHPVGAGLGRVPVFDEGYSEVVDLAAFDDGSGLALYAAVHTRETANGWSSMTTISRWDGTKWHEVVSSFEGEVHDMLVHDDGSGPALYIAGEFTELNGVTVNNIARIRNCQPTDCDGDVTGDQTIDLADLNLVLANFGQATSDGDTNSDNFVDLADLNAVLANFGQGCP